MSGGESEWKWWIRYVVVPIVAGSGLVALLVKQAGQNPQPGADSTPSQEAQSISTKQARLHATVEPESVTMCIPDPSSACISDRDEITYRFREFNGVDVRIESYQRRWILPNGTALYVEPWHPIPGGSLNLDARSTADLPDSVYVPRDVGYRALEFSHLLPESEPELYLEATFLATDGNDHALEARAVIRVFASVMPGD